MKRSYTYEERERIVQFVSSTKERPEMSSFTIAQLLELACPHAPLPHVNTYLRWKREHLSLEEHKAHLSLRGRHRKVSEQQEKLLIGYACDRRGSLLAVTQADLIDFAKSHFNITLPKWVITYITKRAGFSSQKAMNRESRMTTQKVVDDSIAFLEEVRSYKYSLDRIIIMDETGLWSNIVAPRTLHFVNGYTTSVFLKFHVF
jgi:transposase